MRLLLASALALAAPLSSLAAQRGATREVTPVSAPVTDLQYDLSFTRTTAQTRTIHVTTRFSTPGKDPVLLSLPAWTPGAYELSFFAREVERFAATASGKEIRWDKLDYDTWRIYPAGAKSIAVDFDYRADSLDNAMAWSQADFAFFNGTNLFLYPEGRDLSFPATVSVTTEPGWKVVSAIDRKSVV